MPSLATLLCIAAGLLGAAALALSLVEPDPAAARDLAFGTEAWPAAGADRAAAQR